MPPTPFLRRDWCSWPPQKPVWILRPLTADPLWVPTHRRPTLDMECSCHLETGSAAWAKPLNIRRGASAPAPAC